MRVFCTRFVRPAFNNGRCAVSMVALKPVETTGIDETIGHDRYRRGTRRGCSFTAVKVVQKVYRPGRSIWKKNPTVSVASSTPAHNT